MLENEKVKDFFKKFINGVLFLVARANEAVYLETFLPTLCARAKSELHTSPQITSGYLPAFGKWAYSSQIISVSQVRQDVGLLALLSIYLNFKFSVARS